MEELNENLVRQRLKEEIVKVGSKAKFAELIGIEKSAVSKMTSTSGTLPRFETLFFICKKCRVSADYLLGLTDHHDEKTFQLAEESGLSEKAVMNLTSATPEMLHALEVVLNASTIDQQVLVDVVNYLESAPYQDFGTVKGFEISRGKAYQLMQDILIIKRKKDSDYEQKQRNNNSVNEDGGSNEK